MKIYGDEGEDMDESRFKQLSALLKKALDGGISPEKISDLAQLNTYGSRMLLIPKTERGEKVWQRKR